MACLRRDLADHLAEPVFSCFRRLCRIKVESSVIECNPPLAKGDPGPVTSKLQFLIKQSNNNAYDVILDLNEDSKACKALRLTRLRNSKGCARNYPQGGGPQTLFCPAGEGVLLTMCPRGGGWRGHFSWRSRHI